MKVTLLIAISRVVLQNFTSEYSEPWKEMDWWKGVAMPFLDLMGPVAPATLGLGLSGIVYIWGGVELATVTLILIGGFLVPFLPGTAKVGAYLCVLLGISLALYTLWNGGGTRPR